MKVVFNFSPGAHISPILDCAKLIFGNDYYQLAGDIDQHDVDKVSCLSSQDNYFISASQLFPKYSNSPFNACKLLRYAFTENTLRIFVAAHPLNRIYRSFENCAGYEFRNFLNLYSGITPTLTDHYEYSLNLLHRFESSLQAFSGGQSALQDNPNSVSISNKVHQADVVDSQYLHLLSGQLYQASLGREVAGLSEELIHLRGQTLTFSEFILQTRRFIHEFCQGGRSYPELAVWQITDGSLYDITTTDTHNGLIYLFDQLKNHGVFPALSNLPPLNNIKSEPSLENISNLLSKSNVLRHLALAPEDFCVYTACSEYPIERSRRWKYHQMSSCVNPYSLKAGDAFIGSPSHIFDGEEYDQWRQSRLNHLISVFGMEWFRGKKIIEFGCGYGHTSLFLNNLGAECLACEARESSIKIMQDRNLPIKLCQLNNDDPSWSNCFTDNQFDLAIHWGLLYHIQNWEQDIINSLRISKCLSLETAVLTNDDNYLVRERAECGDDQAYLGTGTCTTASHIEKHLFLHGHSFKRYDDPSLNSGQYIYDWIPDNESRWDDRHRRMWIVKS